MHDTLSAVLARYATLVDTQMRHTLAAYTEPRGFYGMMRYHLGWVDERLEPVAAARGKGLRAALLLLVNGALGGRGRVAAQLFPGAGQRQRKGSVASPPPHPVGALGRAAEHQRGGWALCPRAPGPLRGTALSDRTRSVRRNPATVRGDYLTPVRRAAP